MPANHVNKSSTKCGTRSAGGHESGGTGNVPTETGDTIEVVKGDAEFGLTLMPDLNGGTILTEVGTFECDEKRI